MLSYIIGDISFDNFIAEYFEKQPLFLKGQSLLYNEFCIDDFDQYLISGEGSLQDRVRISKDKSAVMIPSYAGTSETQREFVLNQFRAGATLKLEDLDSRHHGMAAFCKELEGYFGGYCFAKPFLTGRGHDGLNVHFDTTEVFVVQLEGSKRWKVWPKLVHNPTLPMQTTLDIGQLPDLEIEVTLERGDILYIPAGTPHCAACQDEYSLHMAVGLAPVKLFEVLEGYLRILSEHVPDLRKNVFPFTPHGDLDDKKATILTKLSAVPFAKMLDDYKIAYSATKHETSNQRLKSLALSESTDPDTKLRLRVGADIVTRQSDDALSVYFSSTISPGKALISTPTAVQLPKYCEDAITFISKTGNRPFAPRDIEGVLNEESKVILCRELLGLGILLVAE